MKVDERLVQALLRLREPGFEALIDYLKGKRQEELENILKVTEPTAVSRQQGRVQELTDLISLIADAEKLRDKFSR
jgi:hypothetical protein